MKCTLVVLTDHVWQERKLYLADIWLEPEALEMNIASARPELGEWLMQNPDWFSSNPKWLMGLEDGIIETVILWNQKSIHLQIGALTPSGAETFAFLIFPCWKQIFMGNAPMPEHWLDDKVFYQPFVCLLRWSVNVLWISGRLITDCPMLDTPVPQHNSFST